ncbi:MAG TPA: serine/threonine-protein kinase [Vicinamibacterales bacterium]|nr:serine/threonine-protein kinase [Vicinamibacterales bacterium]
MTDDDAAATRLETKGPAAAVSAARTFDDGGFTPGVVLQGRYRIVGLIGRGGMGEVYRAQDLKLGQAVALKFLPEEFGRDPARLERFLNEVRIARQISHPNVCRVYDVDDVDGRHFLSMEFVDGEDLASLLRRIGRLPPDKGLEVARQVCAGLAAAHDRGVLHRDLKPANIMLDGRGQARLADFGLAAAADDVGSGDVAGTPAYMAPEQLEGQELSTKTDIYALGLVLHELFTGRRVFDGASIQDLREQHRSRSGSSSTITSVPEIEPAVERVIRRCLEPDPRNRPPSALAVAAALPGGDPLAAALAAGETPSPELVAQAGAEGRLAPAVAWGLLVAIVVGVMATAWLADRVRIYRLVSGMRSPEVLAARAEDLLDALGYGEARFDRIYGLNRNFGLMGYVTESDRRHDRWERVAAQDLPAVQFWYRQSPGPLIPLASGNPDPDDPPLLTPAMVSVELSPRGRLVAFRAVPPHRYEGEPHGAADWSPLFKAAGVDPGTLVSVAPVRTPPTFADTVVAWQGPYPGRPEWTMRLEAASYRARPVWFVVAGPWERTPGPDQDAGPASQSAFTRIAQLGRFGVQALALVAGAWLARRNVRAGRADFSGAVRVALWTGGALLLSSLVSTHYAGTISDVWGRLLQQLGFILFWSILIWMDYLALEPFVRRRWPEAMISWTRLLGGRVGDPLVARDILIGLAGGFVIVLLGDMVAMLPEWLGQLPLMPRGTGSMMRTLGPVSLFAGELLRRPSRILLDSMVMLFTILLAHAVLRNRWAATAVTMAIFAAIALDSGDMTGSILRSVILVGALVLLLSRFGVLAYVAAWFVIFAIFDLPLSLDTSAWYAARSAISASMLLALAGWACYRSLAHGPVLGLRPSHR